MQYKIYLKTYYILRLKYEYSLLYSADNGSKTNRLATAWKMPTQNEMPTSPSPSQVVSSGHHGNFSTDSDSGGPTRRSTAGVSFPPLIPTFHLTSDIGNMKR